MKTNTSKQRAIFLDRDGVINEMVYSRDFGTIDSPLNPKEFQLIKGAGTAVDTFKKLGFLVILVSNQPCIAKGKSSLLLLEAVDLKMKKELAKENGCLDAIYYCLHHDDPSQVKMKDLLGRCNCRKPKPGLLLMAAQDYDIDLKRSYMIGDGLTDIQAGQKAGCKTVFIGSFKAYHFEKSLKEGIKKPDFFAKNLKEASEIIKKKESKKK